MNDAAPEFAGATAHRDDITALRVDFTPIAPDTSVETAADLLLRPECSRMLCLPVVADGKPVGVLSRHVLNGIFLRRFGRELYGARPVSQLMDTQPLIVDITLPLEQAAQYVSSHIGSPITVDFVIVDDGRYVGMGVVLDLLSALQDRVGRAARELAAAYQQLQASQAQLVQSEKMASLGQMVAGVAHEINTPLGYVRNNVEMIRGVVGQLGEILRSHETLSQMLHDEAVAEQALEAQLQACGQQLNELREMQLLEDSEALFDDTLYGVDSIKELVQSLRSFSRLDQAMVAEVSLNDCIDQALTIANHLIRNKVEVIRRYGDIPSVRCSPSQINQVLLNLITNAVQAIEHDQGKILLRTTYDGRYLHIHIQDNGQGISPQHLKKIFDPFFTTKAVGQGTGLGLSISFQIVQAHGGTIRVTSEPGVGTKFVVSLPRSTNPPPAAPGLAE